MKTNSLLLWRELEALTMALELVVKTKCVLIFILSYCLVIIKECIVATVNKPAFRQLCTSLNSHSLVPYVYNVWQLETILTRTSFNSVRKRGLGGDVSNRSPLHHQVVAERYVYSNAVTEYIVEWFRHDFWLVYPLLLKQDLGNFGWFFMHNANPIQHQ